MDVRYFIVNIILLAATVFSRCQDGWTLNKGFCYAFSTDTLPWPQAASTCQVYSARLVQVDSLEKSNWISSEMSARRIDTIWAGGSCRFHSSIWVWVPSYKQLKPFTNWSPGEPSNPQGEQCLEIHQGRQYRWNDLGCGYALRYICEKRPDDSHDVIDLTSISSSETTSTMLWEHKTVITCMQSANPNCEYDYSRKLDLRSHFPRSNRTRWRLFAVAPSVPPDPGCKF